MKNLNGVGEINMKKQKKSKNKKVKEISLPMKFNIGLEKFEPELPAGKSNKRFKSEVNWKWLIVFLILLLILSFWCLVFYPFN